MLPVASILSVSDGLAGTVGIADRQGGLAEGGRGLQVVDAVAVQWGSFRLAGPRAVWCDFGQPLRAPDSDTWAWLYRVLSACSLSGPGPRPSQVHEPAWPAGRQARLVPVPAVPGLQVRTGAR